MPNLTGQSIGRYHILEQLGEGGMAIVYKAYDTRLERNVALKVLRTDQFIPAQLHLVLQRFEREAKSLAKLRHPNIINILDFGEHEGMPYLVMEYLPGGTLKQKLGQKIPWQETLQILLPVARGLAYAHQHGVIHRDVKPANILIDHNEEPILTDFGIAKLLEGTEGHTLTGSGVGIGTPEYMAPEQGIGASTIDARADIYSLGIMLYEMVTGRKPYIADTPMAVVLKQMTDPLPRPTDFVPDLPENVEHVVLKTLAKEPNDRYPDMNSLIVAMESVLTEVKKVESPAETKKVEEKPSVFPAPKKWGKKKALPRDKPSPKVVMTAVGVVVGILLVVLGFPWVKQKFSPAPVAKATLTKTSASPTTPTRTVLPPSAIPESASMPPITPTSTPDPRIQIALDFIQSNEPTYERTFEFSWDKEFYSQFDATKIEDGKLIITDDTGDNSSGDYARGHITPPQGTFGPDRFAVEFEFQRLDSGPDGSCSFYYWGKNGGEVWGMTAEFDSYGQAVLWNTELGNIASYNYDVSKPNTVTIISLGDKIAGFINGQRMYTAINIRRNAIYGEQFFQSNNFAICEFDNYKFWDLTELDVSASTETTVESPAGVFNFPESILTYISNNSSTFEDNFSTTKAGWGNNSEGMAIFDNIENGHLRLRDGIDPNHDGPFLPDFRVPGVAFPTTGLFDASNFALQFSAKFGDTKSLNLQLRSAVTTDTGYRFTLEPSGHWELESSEDAILLAEGNQVISDGYNKVLVIANDNNLAIFINDKPIHVSDGVSVSRTANRIIVIGNLDGATCNFDDFNFWNLDGVDFKQ